MAPPQRILLIVGGGIAAYKTLELIRLLKKAGREVRVVLTKAAQAFVTPLSAAALSGGKVYTDLFDLTDETEMGHIVLSRQADLVVVAPATADLMAKLAGGQANDLASTLLLAAQTLNTSVGWLLGEEATGREDDDDVFRALARPGALEILQAFNLIREAGARSALLALAREMAAPPEDEPA